MVYIIKYNDENNSSMLNVIFLFSLPFSLAYDELFIHVDNTKWKYGSSCSEIIEIKEPEIFIHEIIPKAKANSASYMLLFARK